VNGRVPAAAILAQAEREGWPTSSIDAMANHHMCGNLARDYVNECFALAGEDRAGHPVGRGLDLDEVAPPNVIEGDLMGKLTPKEQQQLQDAFDHLEAEGTDMGAMRHLLDLDKATGAADDTQTKS
jgi:hypothetical protein